MYLDQRRLTYLWKDSSHWMEALVVNGENAPGCACAVAGPVSQRHSQELWPTRTRQSPNQSFFLFPVSVATASPLLFLENSSEHVLDHSSASPTFSMFKCSNPARTYLPNLVSHSSPLFILHGSQPDLSLFLLEELLRAAGPESPGWQGSLLRAHDP